VRYPEPNLNIVSWQQAEVSLRQIREQVFMQEQSVPAELEWDGLDAEAKHLLLNIGQQPVACARLLPTQHLGRMAVLPEWRGKGLGRRLMQYAIDYAQHHAWHAIHISAQIQVQGFYQRFGFAVTSEPYLDAGIWHCDMRLQISPA
jgi:predicted GNAT family N-acyltransferase